MTLRPPFQATRQDWLAAARPHTWPNAFAPVILGTGAAAWQHGADFGRAFLALGIAWALIVGVNISASVNLANNIRDIASDQAAGKITLAVGQGLQGAQGKNLSPILGSGY